MRSRKQLWIAIVCLVAATAATICVKTRTRKVEAAYTSVPEPPVLSSESRVHLSNASLQTIARTTLWDDNDSGSSQRRSTSRHAVPELPAVEEFTLTPPDPARQLYKTRIAVQFARTTSLEHLPSQFPITLGRQKVLLKQSPQNSQEFSTQVDFDWNAFAKEQQLRKLSATEGKQVPVFQGRSFLGMEQIQFVDPRDIQDALQNHRSIHFNGGILNGGVADVFPDHELMITDLSVVEDTGNGTALGRTFDACLPGAKGNPRGAWTFATLMMAIANTNNIQVAEQMLNSMLTAWQTNQTINSFTVLSRNNIGVLGSSGLLGNWPVDPNNTSLPSLLNAPVRLNAIVNRVDLGQNFNPPTAGELRFVFGVTAGTGVGQSCVANPPLFNIILEYKVPTSITPNQWANTWDSIKALGFGETFDSQLQSQITDKVVKANECVDANGNPISCISQVRTNEVELAQGTLLWELREFHLQHDPLGNPVLQDSTVAMTPDSSFNFGSPKCGTSGLPACNNLGRVVSWINLNQNEILATDGALPIVPLVFSPVGAPTPFRGGSALNGGLAFWVDNTQTQNETARIDFSLNTCNGCHGGETFGQNVPKKFQQVFNRSVNQSSTLSDFLLGCVDPARNDCIPTDGSQCLLSTPNLACVETVPDPNPPFHDILTQFGDIARRVVVMQGLVTNGNQSGGMLLPFVAQHVGVH